MGLFDTFWHRYLKRPYFLAAPIRNGSGRQVVFLHGLAGSSEDWRLALGEIDDGKYEVIALDLLGCGRSPKPRWLEYSTDDHAKAVIRTIEKMGLRCPLSIVGHSMGALIAVRVARMRPDLVSHLILYQIPTYVDLPEIRAYSVFNRFYRSLFEFGTKNSNRTIQVARIFGRFVSHMAAGKIDTDSWVFFERSLKNTVLDKEIHSDLKQLRIPIDIIFGKYDLLVLERSLRKAYVSFPNIQFYSIRETHVIRKKAGKIISEILAK